MRYCKMKNTYILCATLIFFFCSRKPNENFENEKNQLAETDSSKIIYEEKLQEMPNFPEVILDSCVITILKLDTTSEIQNLFYDSSKDFYGFKMVSIHVTNGKNEMGYLILEKGNHLTLCLMDCSNGDKIVGTTQIPSLEVKEQFVDFCQSSCNDLYKTFGVVTELKEGYIQTIRAWRVNDKDRQLEEINPTSVDCRDSFYTDYD